MPDRLVLVHGFTQTGRSWAPVLPLLPADVEVVTPDLPGHGTRADVRADLAEAARLVGEDGGRATYVGYSMGGRVALTLALEQPDLVERLVLVSASAGIEDDDDRTARREADDELAAAIEAEGVDAFLEEWLAQPLFASLPRERAGLEARRENTAAGLASALRLLGQGSMEPQWRRLFNLRMPVLVVAGELDEAYCVQAVHLGGWMGEVATLALVPGAGHACHLEQPGRFAALLTSFLAEGHDDHEGHDHEHDHEH
ncbi:MAG TPA: alpha/beta fold hydrolase [Acidimicrobiales bacterium]|nr:alpha/beta fold hydrolase [Acidimicrobiales bacterium]